MNFEEPEENDQQQLIQEPIENNHQQLIHEPAENNHQQHVQQRRQHDNRCCQCPEAINRCTTDECPCFISGKKCASGCERSKWAADCLNQTIIRCFCTSNVNLSMISGSIGSQHSNNPQLSKTHKDKQLETFTLCNATNCDCFKFKEKCGLECICKGECSNIVSKFALSTAQRPLISCKCGSGKKSCAKSDKCACKKLFQHCSPTCKCKRDCTNGKFNMDLTKASKLCFVSPDQETSAVVARLTSDNYNFQFEYSNEKHPDKHVEDVFYDALINVLMHYTLPVKKVVIYLTKSPCFHQDCDPKCEVLNECAENKACAKVLATAFRQLKKRTKDTTLQMTVKFLFPNVKRGDLFTKQGILALMMSGVSVEPICMKEWGELLKDKNTTGDNDNLAGEFAQYYSTWTACGMENYVRQTQLYINECRRVMGMKEAYWSSDIHDALKVSLSVAQKSKAYFDDISRRLIMINEKSDSSTKETPFLMSELVNATTTLPKPIEKKAKKKYTGRSNTGPTVLKNGQPKLSVFEANFDDANFTMATNDVGKSPSNNTLAVSSGNLSSEMGSQLLTMPTPYFSGNENIDRLLLTLSCRNITEEERVDIKNELLAAVENLKHQIQQFTELIEQRITTTSL